MAVGNEGFFERVYCVVSQIPFGRVTSYGAIARYLGSGRSARMVGWAMNQSHSQPLMVPAHRVVNRNGLLTGKHHFGGSELMADLLRSEGVEVVNNHVVNFSKYYWDPASGMPDSGCFPKIM
ncbi:MAG TPA: cysteine methyltransferase [Bacteroidales bacterium]|nr:MAG: cysteine methyltransferase [Bacteroidetes bacterium GWE2_42_24]OFY28717.1 MAG: cysteine methyltransferase [Bacteroidetes bacterium GWF2_43_11]PKP23942.1 MAG: cysteine methyltransferase [Bacteroidetes bacterium HGW-Bacteroidetes-22]HBZ66192.1 cysteine methyltransferase [Bacteroidales bacterium]